MLTSGQGSEVTLFGLEQRSVLNFNEIYLPKLRPSYSKCLQGERGIVIKIYTYEKGNRELQESTIPLIRTLVLDILCISVYFMYIENL